MTGPWPSRLTSHLTYGLRDASIHVTHAPGPKLASHGVAVAEWTVLRELYGLEAMAPGRVADRLGLTRGAIGRLADRLSERGLLSRREHHPDGRTPSIMLTAEGETRVARLAAIADEHAAGFFATLSKDDRRAPERRRRGLVQSRGLRPMAGLL